jgi:uncharacterized protein YegL
MNKDHTDITIILDRSGSMESIKTDVEGGFATFLEEQKKLPGKATLSLVQFDTEYEAVYSGKPIAEAPALKLVPRGPTALHDAIGRTINAIGERLSKLPEADRPGKVMVVIITDGHENSSSEFSAAMVKDMITHQTEKYSWDFTYLGANQDAVLVASQMGILSSKSMTFGANAKGSDAVFRSMSAYAAQTREGVNASYSAEQRTEALGN